jgi:DNA repair exonuclease SbcCD nuclease subunit
MQIALITDTHFGARGDSEILTNFFDKFYSEIFFPYLIKNNIKEIIHLGDAFDRRKFINFQSLLRCKQYFYDNIKKNNIKLHQIIGNHDTYFKNTNDVNSPSLLLGEYKDNIELYSDPTEVDIDGTKILMMPWICQDNYDKAMNLINNSTASVLMGHLELDGFEMYRGAVHTGGMEAKLFSKFNIVMSGHFHHRSNTNNIHYLGCPYEMTWSDYNDPKGFHIFNTKTNQLDFIKNPLVLFNKVKYNDSDWNFEMINNFDFSNLKDTYVKIIVINKTNPYWFDLFVNKIEKNNPAAIQIVDDNLNLDLVDDENILENIDDTLTILNTSIQSMNLDIDRNKLNDLFKSLYNEATQIA